MDKFGAKERDKNSGLSAMVQVLCQRGARQRGASEDGFTLARHMSEADGPADPVVQIRILRNVADLVRTADLQQLTHRGVREWLRTHLELESGTHYSKVPWRPLPASTPHARP